MDAGLLPEGIFVSPAFFSRMSANQEQPILKLPKLEPRSVDEDPDVDPAVTVPSEFLAPGYHRLPRVQPLENSGTPLFPAAAPFPSPHPVFCAPEVDQRAVQAERTAIPSNLRSRYRRKGISERIRLLGKLMPWDRKMNTSTVLEEARNYVRFLEAQVTVLQCMPTESLFTYPLSSAVSLRGLEKLTRQQLLHVLVRSPLVQDKLCSRGLCVFSAEQVFLMRQAAGRKKSLHQQPMLLDTGSTSTISE